MKTSYTVGVAKISRQACTSGGAAAIVPSVTTFHQLHSARFADRLLAARMARGLTQAGLARELSVSRQALTLWEVSGASATTERVVKLAHALGCDPAWLGFGPSEEPPWTLRLDLSESYLEQA